MLSCKAVQSPSYASSTAWCRPLSCCQLLHWLLIAFQCSPSACRPSTPPSLYDGTTCTASPCLHDSMQYLQASDCFPKLAVCMSTKHTNPVCLTPSSVQYHPICMTARNTCCRCLHWLLIAFQSLLCACPQSKPLCLDSTTCATPPCLYDSTHLGSPVYSLLFFFLFFSDSMQFLQASGVW